MPPTVGGIQKRIGTLATSLNSMTDLEPIIIQRRGAATHGDVRAISLGQDNPVENGIRAIDQLLCTRNGRGRLLYVSKPISSDPGGHLSSVASLSERFDHTIIRVASTRSARIVAAHSRLIADTPVALHCLNRYSYDLLAARCRNEVRLFHNPAGSLQCIGPIADGPVVFAGRLVRSKNVLNLLSAWRSLECDVGPSELHIWGPRLDDYSDRVIREATIQPNVRYMGSYACSSAAGLQEARIVVVPSYREGASNVVSEALALGKPVVGSEIPGVCDYLPPAICNLIKPPFGPDAIAVALRAALLQIERCGNLERLGAKIRAWYEVKLGNDRELEILLSLVGDSTELLQLTPASLSDEPKGSHPSGSLTV